MDINVPICLFDLAQREISGDGLRKFSTYVDKNIKYIEKNTAKRIEELGAMRERFSDGSAEREFISFIVKISSFRQVKLLLEETEVTIIDIANTLQLMKFNDAEQMLIVRFFEEKPQVLKEDINSVIEAEIANHFRIISKTFWEAIALSAGRVKRLEVESFVQEYESFKYEVLPGFVGLTAQSADIVNAALPAEHAGENVKNSGALAGFLASNYLVKYSNANKDASLLSECESSRLQLLYFMAFLNANQEALDNSFKQIFSSSRFGQFPYEEIEGRLADVENPPEFNFCMRKLVDAAETYFLGRLSSREGLEFSSMMSDLICKVAKEGDLMIPDRYLAAGRG